MDTPKIFDSELKLCEILWQHQPVKSSELVRLCADQLGWKKSTTYTVIKRLTDRGVVNGERHRHRPGGQGGRAARREPRLRPAQLQWQPARLPQRLRGRQGIDGGGGR